MDRYSNFIKENKDIVEFPIKKYISLIRNIINNKIEEGENKFEFNFLGIGNLTLPIRFYLIIKYNKGGRKYSASVNEENILSNKFDGFDLNVFISDKEIDYNQVYSMINHEMKHVYDLYYDSNKNSLNSIDGYHYLKIKYSNNKYLLDFIELSNLALKHELDARLRMIYDKLRWLKTYDKTQLVSEFKNTYIYKSLMMLNDFNYMILLGNVKKDIIVQFTNDFIKYFIKSNNILSTESEILNFYKKSKDSFKKISKEYLENSYKVIEELIKDKKPYVENKLFSSNLDYNKINEKFLENIIKHIFK